MILVNPSNPCLVLTHLRLYAIIFLEMETTPKKNDKRNYPRIKVSAALRYQIRGTSDFNNVLSDNVSTTGLGFINDGFIAPSSNLTIEINILSRILNPIGRIAWSSPVPHSNKYRLGVEFLEINPVEKRYLNDYIGIQIETSEI